jgi:hypothetical protein
MESGVGRATASPKVPITSSRIFVLSLVATLFVVGSYLIVIFTALWLGDADTTGPLKVAFLTGVLMIVGNSLLTFGITISERKYGRVYPELGALGLELLAL